MKPTEELVNEHKAVLVALQILEKIEEALASSATGAQDDLEQLLDFFKGFVDLCHHGKEEDVLFPELVRCGVPKEGGPIGVMLAEHEAGRRYVREMVDGLARLQARDGNPVGSIRASAQGYRDLLRAHIFKENNVLFPMADRLFSDAVAADVLARFEGIERDRVGEGKHEAYHAMLHRLKDTYKIV